MKITGLFDNKKYNKLAMSNYKNYSLAKPFPHIAFKNFLNIKIAKELSSKFPKYNENTTWISHQKYARNANTNFKKSTHDERKFPLIFREFLRELNSRQFILFLEALTGINGLIPDPYFIGGGIHIAKEDGHVNIHTDFNWHHKLQAHRRVNALIYLTPNWKIEYGGNIEFWNANKTKKIIDHPPEFNSCVIFNTNATSFHGHPNPVKGGKKIFRRVLNMYYYSTTRKKSEIYNPTFTTYKKIIKTKINPKKFRIENSSFCNEILENYKKFR